MTTEIKNKMTTENLESPLNTIQQEAKNYGLNTYRHGKSNLQIERQNGMSDDEFLSTYVDFVLRMEGGVWDEEGVLSVETQNVLFLGQHYTAICSD